jgi:magnesium transporter
MTATIQPTKRFYHLVPGAGPAELPDLDSAVAAMNSGGYVWLNFLDPPRKELEALIEPLGLHPLAIEDCLDENQIPKIEDYLTNTFILFNVYFFEEKTLTVDEVDLFVGKKFFVLSCRNLHGRPRFLDRLLEEARADIKNVALGPDRLLHVILDYIVDQKFHAIEFLQEELDGMEEEIIGRIATFNPHDLMHLRKNLLMLRKSITHEREIMVKICRKDSPFISDGAIFDFRDIYDHLAKFYEESEIYREMISSIMEMYLSMMNNRMTMLANRTNQVVRRLTLITTIFMPMTLLAGIGGMSEWSMMTGPENWKIAYPLFLVAMLLVGVLNYIILKRLESRDDKSEM